MTSQTATRRRLIRRLVVDGRVESQRQLVDLLSADGHHVTQATVSRDLAAIGASKTRDHAGTCYVIDDQERFAAGDATERLAAGFTQFVEGIAHSANIVVIHTTPGAAHLVASGIDGAAVDGVLGTVAGDDTIFVVATPAVGGAALQRTLELIGAG
jgi:transcriptional regulator of arginine metabolism